NRQIPTADDIVPEDEAALGRMLRVAADLAREAGISQDGYRLMINCREHGGQEVFHLHLHLLGGCSLGPMLAR
ncbi:MAG TPA: HIT domain-containing protein, partial [Calditrichia bacterium]|nr:HIT domain-containing protein [Calditrichia bacterium]